MRINNNKSGHKNGKLKSFESKKLVPLFIGDLHETVTEETLKGIDPAYIEENHSNWLRFMELKKKVISERNRLVKHDLDMTLILEWITKLKADFQNTKNNIQDTFLQRMNTADTLFKNRELKEQLEEEFVRQEH